MQPFFFWRQKKKPCGEKEKRRGDSVFPPDPLETAHGGYRPPGPPWEVGLPTGKSTDCNWTLQGFQRAVALWPFQGGSGGNRNPPETFLCGSTAFLLVTKEMGWISLRTSIHLTTQHNRVYIDRKGAADKRLALCGLFRN